MAFQSKVSRRGLLHIGAVAGSVVALQRFGGALRLAHADAPAAPQLLLVAYFGGGWDQLLALDPRDNTDPRFQRDAAYANGGSGIHPAYDQVTDTAVKALLASNPSGVQKAGALTFGPAVPASFLAHAADLSILRGIAMDTLTHEVGRRYFTTGKFPRGLSASGSSLTTLVAAGDGGSAVLPNLAIDTEAYNEGQPAFASPIRVESAPDLLTILRPLGAPLADDSQKALEAFQDAPGPCDARDLDAFGLASLFRASQRKARSVTSPSTALLFDFNLKAPTPEVKALFDAFGIATAADLAGPKGRAALAAQALVQGVSQATSVQMAGQLDTHFDWDQEHATPLREGFDALGRLIAYLKATPVVGTSASAWSRTTLLAFSEFSRTPLVNTRNGRDHHLAGSCLVAGPGLRGGLVIGGTTDTQMAARGVNFATGAADDAGAKLRPADIHATLLQSMGFSTEPLANQTPQLLTTLLR
jgi:uncharacterized protein (DUF1501 family)